MEHVVIFQPEFVKAAAGRPRINAAIEARDRPGPAYKAGVGTDEVVWIRMGPLLVARATVEIAWHGEYAMLRELRSRAKGTQLFKPDEFWTGKPKVGYAVVARLKGVRFLDKAELAGPRTYGYDWIVIDNEKKRETWLDTRPPEEKDRPLLERFRVMKRKA